MSTPTLYIKQGCPYCAAAMDYLDERQIEFETIDVRGNTERMNALEKISGKTKTPTIVWDGKMLADFGVEELKRFLDERGVESGSRS